MGNTKLAKTLTGLSCTRRRQSARQKSDVLEKSQVVTKSRSVDSDTEAAGIEQMMIEDFNASDLLGIVMQTPDEKRPPAIKDGKADDGDEEEEEEEEDGPAELLAKSITAGRQKIAKLEKQIMVLMTDANAVGSKARTEGLVKGSLAHKQIMMKQSKLLQKAVTKKDASKADIDAMIDDAEEMIEEAKAMHSEFKPHIKALNS